MIKKRVRYWCDYHREKASSKQWKTRQELAKAFGCKIVKIVEYR